MNDPAVIQLKETNKTLQMFNKTQLMISMNFKSYASLVIFSIITALFCFFLNTKLCRRMQVSSIEGCFDPRSFRSKTRVSSIEDKSQFDRRQESVRSKTVTID